MSELHLPSIQLEKFNFYNEYLLMAASYDGGTRYPGTRLAPGILINWIRDHEPTIFSKIKLASNIPIPVQNSNLALTMIEKFSIKSYQNGNKQLVIGGDHSISFPCVKAAQANFNDLVVIVFDAHHDLDSSVLIKNWSVINEIAQVVNKVAIIGVRYQKAINTPENVEIIYMDEIDELGTKQIDQKVSLLLEQSQNYYLSIDLDVLDPSEFPGVSYPVPGGLSFRELKKIISNLLEKKTPVGIDIVEFNPTIEKEYSTNVITSILKTIEEKW